MNNKETAKILFSILVDSLPSSAIIRITCPEGTDKSYPLDLGYMATIVKLLTYSPYMEIDIDAGKFFGVVCTIGVDGGAYGPEFIVNCSQNPITNKIMAKFDSAVK